MKGNEIMNRLIRPQKLNKYDLYTRRIDIRI